MNNNTERLARKWAEQVQQFDAEYERKGRRYSGDPMRAAANFILAHTTQPTMAEVEWDDNKHYLAEATHPANGPVLMLGQDIDDMIKFLELNGAASKTFWGNPEDLTLTGKRYTLTEVETHAS